MPAFGLTGFRRLGMLLNEKLYSEFHFGIVPYILLMILLNRKWELVLKTPY